MYAVIRNDSVFINDRRCELIHQYSSFSLVRIIEDMEIPRSDGHLLHDRHISVNGQRLRLDDGHFERGTTPRHLIRFAGPIARAWLKKLSLLDIKVHFHCPPHGLCIEFPTQLTHTQLIDALPMIVAMAPYRRQQCSRALRFPSATCLPADWIDLVCFSQTIRDQVAANLIDMGHTPLAPSRYKLRIRGDIDLSAIRGIRGVKIADHARPTQLAWAPLQLALGSSETGNTAIGGPFTGLSQVIAVADTGLDHGSRDETLHDDFQNRVRALHSWPIDASWDDYLDTPRHDDGAADQNSGHGTHVAGLALGSGARSHGKYSGVAPKAELVFQAIEQYTPVRTDRRDEIAPGYYLNGRPMDLVELFEQARGDGARIHVNAWGDPAAGQYTDDSYEADRFLWKYQDAVILFAAGNNGSDNNGDRQLDASSLYAPASGKNVIAVGATEGPLAGVGYRGTWAGFDPDRHRFTNYATRSDPISGQPERMAMISSTGPTHDGRIKPDLCAPGTNLPAPRSRATAAQGWGLTSPMPHYMYLGGTSMATGVAGGFAALVRQAWQQRLGEAPSGPALKALLLFGCQAIARRDGNGIESRFSAGFGRLHLPGSLPRPGLTLVDAVNAGLDSGGKRQFHFTQEREDSLRVLLAWYDYPGERLINDLDLCLIQADGRRIWGNHNAGGDGDPDRINTVELIDLERLAPGRHTLEVIGANVPAGPQGFALVLNRTLEEQTATSPADERATPAARLLRLPVEWLKGIGATYEKRLHEAGIETLVQLVTRDDRELAALMQAPAYRIEKIRQRLTRLAAISEALPPALPDISLKQLLRSRPASLTPQEWQPLQQLEEIFDKDILGRIRLMPLEG